MHPPTWTGSTIVLDESPVCRRCKRAVDHLVHIEGKEKGQNETMQMGGTGAREQGLDGAEEMRDGGGKGTSSYDGSGETDADNSDDSESDSDSDSGYSSMDDGEIRYINGGRRSEYV